MTFFYLFFINQSPGANFYSFLFNKDVKNELNEWQARVLADLRLSIVAGLSQTGTYTCSRRFLTFQLTTLRDLVVGKSE